ncbi:MAG TPA: hypothetical protein VND93_11170 [Myxococcales bacterium]|jgi:hypothetical protein|nr:hypothetical protein [Myxococcales bacterium]
MGDAAKIYLAGRARVIRQDGQWIVLSRKGAALLAYLALQGRVRRSSIASLLWPDLGEPVARANLRELLGRLHAMVGLPALVGGGESLQLEPSTWVDLLHDPDVDGRNLLAGHSYQDCPALAGWIRSERDGLRGEQTTRLWEELGRCFGAVAG